MNYISWNVRGLIDLTRKYYVRDARQRVVGLDVLYLHEVKIVGFMLNIACHVIWLDSLVFASQHEVGRGGVVTLISPCWLFVVISHDFDPMQRIVWVLLSIDNLSIGIVNVYAPNDVVDRSYLWHWIVDNLPPATWVMCGDFNMVEVVTDKDEILSFCWTTGEQEAWYYMRNKLGLFNPNTNRRRPSGV